MLEDEIIVYDGSAIKGEEEEVHLNTEHIKDEEISFADDESMTQWIAEITPEEDVERKQKNSMNTTADDDLKIQETANMFCDICQQPLESLKDAKSHYKLMHGTLGYIVCCNRKFKQKCRLVEHVNTHYNFTYPCPQCDKTFDSKAYLGKHMACHETVKIYVSSFF